MDLQVTGIGQVEQFADYWDLWFQHRALGLVTEAIAEDARLRLEDDETAPDGSRWDPWSPSYALTRGAGHKLLFDSGDLADSIMAKVQGANYVVGSELDYALVHQSSRPYVGVSGEVEQAIDDILAADMDAGWESVRI